MGQIELGKIVCGEKKRNVFVLIRERAGKRERERETETERQRGLSKYCKASANMYCSYSS